MTTTTKRTVCGVPVVDDGRPCKRLPNHKGACRIALTRKAARAMARKSTPRKAGTGPVKPPSDAQIAAREKFAAMARAQAAARKAARTVTIPPAEVTRVVAAPRGGSTKHRPRVESSGQPAEVVRSSIG